MKTRSVKESLYFRFSPWALGSARTCAHRTPWNPLLVEISSEKTEHGGNRNKVEVRATPAMAPNRWMTALITTSRNAQIFVPQSMCSRFFKCRYLSICEEWECKVNFTQIGLRRRNLMLELWKAGLGGSMCPILIVEMQNLWTTGTGPLSCGLEELQKNVHFHSSLRQARISTVQSHHGSSGGTNVTQNCRELSIAARVLNAKAIPLAPAELWPNRGQLVRPNSVSCGCNFLQVAAPLCAFTFRYPADCNFHL